jgi:hypothetical protein
VSRKEHFFFGGGGVHITERLLSYLKKKKHLKILAGSISVALLALDNSNLKK